MKINKRKAKKVMPKKETIWIFPNKSNGRGITNHDLPASKPGGFPASPFSICPACLKKTKSTYKRKGMKVWVCWNCLHEGPPKGGELNAGKRDYSNY